MTTLEGLDGLRKRVRTYLIGMDVLLKFLVLIKSE